MCCLRNAVLELTVYFVSILFPSYVPALLASAECHYQLASQSIRQGLFPVAISHIENGINFGAKSAELQPNYSSVWYQIGEIGMLGRYFDTNTKFNSSATNLFTDNRQDEMVFHLMIVKMLFTFTCIYIVLSRRSARAVNKVSS